MDEHTTNSTGEDKPGMNWPHDFDDARSILKSLVLAGLGAVAIATEASEETFQALMRKGEEAREDAAREFRDARRRSADRGADSERFIRSRIDGVLARVNVASKSDIDVLNAKLNIITKKLDEGRTYGATGTGSNPDAPPASPTNIDGPSKPEAQ